MKNGTKVSKYRGMEVWKEGLNRSRILSPGEVVRFDDMLEEYYARRGWPGGVPDREKREELGPA